MQVSARARAGACVRACMCVCACTCVGFCMWVCMCMCVCIYVCVRAPVGSRSVRGAVRWRTDVLTGCSAPTTGVRRTIRRKTERREIRAPPIPPPPRHPCALQPPRAVGAPLLPVPPCRREGTVVRAPLPAARNCTKFPKVHRRAHSHHRGRIFRLRGGFRSDKKSRPVARLAERERERETGALLADY